MCCVAALCVSLPRVKEADAAWRAASEPRVLIDPGHGGADGGATGVNGTQEKTVNLAVSRTIYALLRVMGVQTDITREDDRSIHSADATTLREQKVSDMHNRLAMYDQATLVVSVHQNHFSQSQYSGTQVFCSPNHPQSRVLGEHIRGAVLGLLQPENTRELKMADDSVFLLANTQTPAVLVECGFVSNSQEEKQLLDPSYQQRVGEAVAQGMENYALLAPESRKPL
jgi:N-acetylmuramoyl-L-alanine amidase